MRPTLAFALTVMCTMVPAAAVVAETLSSIRFTEAPLDQSQKLEVRNAELARVNDVTGWRITPTAGEGPGWIAFDAAVDSKVQNYLTLKVWGGEQTWGPLHLYTGDGSLDLGNIWWFNTREEPFPGRWVYRTYPVPRELTGGKTSLRLRLQNVPAPSDPGAFRKGDDLPPPVSYRPTFAVYGVYSHTDPLFEVPAAEKQGKPFEWGPRRPKPDGYPAIDERLKQRALADIEHVMKYDVLRSGYGEGLHRPLTRAVHALALIYQTPWSGHYRDDAVLQRVRDSLDIQVKRMAAQGGDPGTMFYRGWLSFGNLAIAYSTLHEQLAEKGWLEETITLPRPSGERTVSRREAYADFFHDAFEWRRMDRRHYTNQPIHISWTLYNTQTALRLLGDPRALTQQQALWYVHEAVGLVPHRSREFGINGDAAGFPYHLITDKGLTRELGYVDGYGELSGDLVKLARVTNCPLVKQQAIKFVDTRSYFRIPTNDADGYRALRGIGFMSWRGPNYPYIIRYDGITQAAALKSPAAIRLAQLEIEHGRPYLLPEHPERGAHWNAVDSIHLYEDYLAVSAMPKTDHRLPMEPEHGDFVFSDEEIGVYAFRHGDTRVYGTFFFNFPPYGKAIGDMGVVRYTRPDVDRVADVHFPPQAPASGLFDSFTYPFGTRKYEQAPLPPGMSQWPELPPNAVDRRQGLAYFYTIHLGDYLIGMNTTEKGSYRESTYRLNIPEGVERAVDVHTGKVVDVGDAVQVGPRMTVVLHLTRKEQK